MKKLYATTILSVRIGKKVALGGDGQVTLGNTIIKDRAKKIRKIYNNKILIGIAGATSDAFSLLDMFETKVKIFNGNIIKAADCLSKEWRDNKIFRNLEAMILVANKKITLIITGLGDVLEPINGIGAIGSGGIYAQSSAMALKENTNLSAFEIVKKSLNIAGKLCIYTNLLHTIETLE